MSINIFSIDDDKVIKSKFITGKTDYRFALHHLVPLIDKLDIQRKIQDAKFYRRLEKDMTKGCILPPLTLAFIVDSSKLDPTIVRYENYINRNISSAFVLDGIQRLNTLARTNKNNPNLDLKQPLFLNILFCDSMDNLLYRMITLNNGQKPMTARHQIEILAGNIYNFNDSPVAIQTEKERGKRSIRGSFNRADVIKAYIAFLSNTTNIDNQKIIEEKMDELIAEKILDSNITDDNLEFSEILNVIEKFSEDPDLLNWFKNNENNMIGFAVGIRKSFENIKSLSTDEFKKAVTLFEDVFRSFNVSKIKVGQQRRKTLEHFISHFSELNQLEENDLLEILSDI